MNKAPSIRFNGFTADWEQFKFSEITFPAGEKNKDNLPYESYSITNEDGFIPQDEKFGNCGIMWDADKRMYYIVSPQSFAYNPARINVGSIGYQNLDKTVIVSSLYEVFKTTEDVDDRFLWHWFKSNDFQKLIFQFQEGGVRLYFYYDKLCRGSIALPRVEEQKRIGAYLDQLDHLITLHQRKYEQMSSVLLSMREKLFAKPNAPFPESRFAGFSGAWQWRKLRDIADKVTEKNVDSAVRETFTNSAEFGVISQRKYFDHEITNTDNIGGYFIVRPQNFVYNPRISTSAPVGPINRNRLGRVGVVSPLYTVFRSHDIDTVFLEWYFKSSYWHQFMYYYGNTGARHDRFSINDEVFFEMPIPWPDIEEQRKIGRFLENIDLLIALYRQRLEKLKNIKAACLEGMFV